MSGPATVPNSTSTPAGAAKSLAAGCFAHALGFFFMVVFPGLFTAIAPVTWITLTRADGQVTARVDTCLFFAIPFHTATVSPVTGLGQRVREGTWDRKREVKSESEGFLTFEGRPEPARATVSPASLPSVADRAQAFLDGDAPGPERIVTVANWKFGVLAAAPLSLLTVLYVGCWLLAPVVWLLRLVGLVGRPGAA